MTALRQVLQKERNQLQVYSTSNFQKELLPNVVRDAQVEIGKREAAVILENRGLVIREMNPDDVSDRLCVTIPLLASMYGSRETMEAYMLDECCNLIEEYFFSISLEEIKLAFQLASVGKLQLKNFNLYGSFNAAILGRVLRAYLKYRKAFLSEYEKAAEIKEKAAQNEIRAKKGNEQLRKNFPELIEKGKEKYQSWRDVPTFWYDFAIQNGFLQVDVETKTAYYKRSEPYGTENVRSKILGGPARGRMKKLQQLENGELGYLEKTQWIIVSKQMIVFEKLLGKKIESQTQNSK